MITEVVAAIIAIVAFFVILRGLTKDATETPTRTSTNAKSSRPSRRRDRKTCVPSENEKTGADYAKEFLELSGDVDRSKEIPGWAMLFHSPLNPPANPTSWIGSTPKAPEVFVWPSTPKGVRQHFLAQINLEALSETENNGLPKAGALLIFFSYEWTDGAPDYVYTCHILTADEMREARDVPVPHDLETLDQRMGFFHPNQTFIKRGVDLVPFLDDGTSPPACIPNVFDTPELWISNWGLALTEVEIVLEQLQRCVEPLLGQRGERHLDDLHERSSKMPHAKHLLVEIENTKVLASQGPEMLETLTVWRDLAQSRPASDVIDLDALNEVFIERAALAEQLKHHIAPILKEGAHEAIWRKAQHDYLANHHTDTAGTERHVYRAFVDQKATGWRGHRLFGIEPPFGNNWEDLRGQDCLISIREDTLLGTMSEHFYGLSIWCPRDDMAKGKLESGQVVRHCAV